MTGRSPLVLDERCSRRIWSRILASCCSSSARRWELGCCRPGQLAAESPKRSLCWWTVTGAVRVGRLPVTVLARVSAAQKGSEQRCGVRVLAVANAVDQVVLGEAVQALLNSTGLEPGELLDHIPHAEAFATQRARDPHRRLLGALGLLVASLEELGVQAILDRKSVV